MIDITLYVAGPGMFEARLGDRTLCTSRTPFCAAARILLAEGRAKDELLRAFHAGSNELALQGSLGIAAQTTVWENNAVGPVFKPWRPYRGPDDEP